jgi:endonuclease/exonuclease/phosphatase family metal-dependent hydrolase
MRIPRAGAAAAALLALCAAPAVAADGARLRVLTFNAWTGLDYVGSFRMGEHERAERREARFAALVAQARALDPDVIFLQEANPVGEQARRLASALGMTEIHQVVNGGIKLGPFGLPTNLKEGNAILARPALRLAGREDWKLSGPPGLYGDAVTFHLGEAIFALAGRITVGTAAVWLVDVHLVDALPDEPALRRLRELPEGRALAGGELERALAQAGERNTRWDGELAALVRHLATLPAGAPVILGGDFNVDAGAPRMRRFVAEAGMIDAQEIAWRRSGAGGPPPRTWDPARNDNIAFSTRPHTASGAPLTGYGLLDALASTLPERIDYVLLAAPFREEDVLSAGLALEEKRGGVYASDHFGVAADIDLTRAVAAARSKAP